MTDEPGSQDLAELARNLQILLLDVDGVLTDGGIILIGQDEEAKRFDVHDGMGVNLARAAGIKVGIITSRKSAVVERRARELNIDDVIQGSVNKREALNQLIQKYNIDATQVAYIGDDLQDIPILNKVGVPIAVQNAIPAVKECSMYVTRACGGHGAVREAVEWLLDLRGVRDMVYNNTIGEV